MLALRKGVGEKVGQEGWGRMSNDKGKPMSAEEAIRIIEDGDWGQRLSVCAMDDAQDKMHEAFDLAIAALREKAARENPEPLALPGSWRPDDCTIVELEGSPVWLKAKSGDIRCGVVCWKERNRQKGWAIAFGYGWEWLDDAARMGALYAHKPCGEGIAKMCNWNKCSSRTPEDDERVIAYGYVEYPVWDKRSRTDATAKKPFVREAKYSTSGGGHFSTVCNAIVTHWMPMPEPPQDEGMLTWSTAHSFDFGQPVTCPANSGAWTYADTGAPAPEDRPCPRCGQHRGEDGIDPCLGKLPGVAAACCGHGVEDGYVLFENGVCIRGRFVVEKPMEAPHDT